MQKAALTLQRATKEDIPFLCHLLGELFTKESDFKKDYEKQERALHLIIADEKIGHILVAKEDGKTLGMVSLLYTVSTALGAKVAMLEDMVVTNKEHNRGIGSALLSFAIEFASKQGYQRITLLSDDDNTKAHAFYERHSFSFSHRKVLVKMLTCKDF